MDAVKALLVEGAVSARERGFRDPPAAERERAAAARPLCVPGPPQEIKLFRSNAVVTGISHRVTPSLLIIAGRRVAME